MGRAGYGKGLAEEGLREGQETGLTGKGRRRDGYGRNQFDKAVAPGDAENVYQYFT